MCGKLFSVGNDIAITMNKTSLMQVEDDNKR